MKNKQRKHQYYELLKLEYNELVQISNELLTYYDIDRIRFYSIYVWTKGENGENVFNIHKDEIIYYDKNHKIVKDALPIIKRIQDKLKDISIYLEDENYEE